MAVCDNCQRDLLLSQLVEGPEITGRCPWCGTLLAPHYTLLLADAVRRAESAGAELVRALAQLDEGWATLQIRPESVLDPIRVPLTTEEPPSRPVLRQAASEGRVHAGERDMTVEDACRPGLFTVDIDDSLEVAAHRMDQAQLGALAVVDGQRLVGMSPSEASSGRSLGRPTPPTSQWRRMRRPARRRPASSRTPGQSSSACSSWGSPPSGDK
jgi:CBS domain-containing protein